MPRTEPILRDPRWAAVVARDSRADGTFYYSVATTGVYCRPSCASRQANPKNVRFHRTASDAERAGFRACRRCKPDQPPLEQLHAVKVADICRVIEAAEETPSLAVLAKRAGLSPYHFHRVFKAVTGLTPKAYASAPQGDATRPQRAQKKSKTVTLRAIYDAGFNSGARFYAASDQLLGMTPTDYPCPAAPTRRSALPSGMRPRIHPGGPGAKGVCAILLGDDADALVRDLRTAFRARRWSAGTPRSNRSSPR
jgi:AraC family transcriptional regulator of adaptative response/methylated-DNA-[protein]-cysteine methyltransferase